MFLAHKGVEVEVKNVRKDLQEMQQMVRMGSQATPTTGRAGELIIGLDLKRISANLGIKYVNNQRGVRDSAFSRNKAKMVTPTEALSGWEQPASAVPEWHAVLGTPLKPPFPEGLSTAVLGLGCFWGGRA